MKEHRLGEPDEENRRKRIFPSLPSSSSGELKYHLYSSFAANLVIPIFSLYVPLLAVQLGASVFEIGLVGGSANGVYSFMPFIMGRLSERARVRKIFILCSFSLLTAVSVSYVLISTPVALIFARVFEGIGWAMLWPALEAGMTSGLSQADGRRALSVFNFTWSGSAAIGPLLGSALIYFTSIRDSFVFTALILAVSAAVNLRPFLFNSSGDIQEGLVQPGISVPLEVTHTEPEDSLTEKVSIEEETTSPEGRHYGTSFYMLCTALSAVCSGVLFTFFTPLAGSIGIPILLIGLITFALGLGRFLIYMLTVNEKLRFFLMRSDRRGKTLVASLGIMSLASLSIMARDPSGTIYLGAFAIVGVTYSLVYAICQAALIAEAAPGKFGRGAGLFESSIGIGATVGPIIAGAISGRSVFFPFATPAIGFVAFAIAAPILTKWSKAIK